MKLLSSVDLKLLWRDLRSGELNVLVAALLVAVTTVTSIALFSSRIENSIFDEAASLLAADAQITGSKEIPGDWVKQAEAADLDLAYITSFQAMSFGANDSLQLSSVKAVSDAYPLKGELEIAQDVFADGIKVNQGPKLGEAWVNSRLMASLGLKVGDVIGVGDADFTVAQVLVSEPDEAGGFDFSPKVMINRADVEQTGAVQVGSRVRYTLLMAGDVDSFYQQWKPQQGDHHRWRSIEDANESITQTLGRAESFLLLAGSLGVILAGVALALASKRFANRQLGHVALLKTFGLTPRRIARLYAGNLSLLGLILMLIGLLAGWFLHWAFLELFAGLLPRELAAPSLKPYWVGAVTGLVCLVAFALPPVWVLKDTPPARVLRSDVAGGTTKTWQTTLLGTVAVFAIVYFYSNSALITGALMAAGAIAIIGVTLMARGLIILARKLASRLGTVWRLGLASLQRHGSQNSFQIMIFAMALMLLFTLTLLRTSLLTQWQNQLPEGTPNHFAFNIFAEDKPGVEQFFADNQISSTPFYPMIRGRLVEVSGETIQERLDRLKPDGDDFRRELNITWSDELAENNELVKGVWFEQVDPQQLKISVEEDFAESLAIDLGDTLAFSFGGQSVSATVTSIRSVQWDSLTPNFYIIFDQPILSGAGAAFLTSFYLAESQKPLLVELLGNFSTMSVVEVDVILNQVQSIISQVTVAIEFILALVLVAGVIVLIASVQATLDNRLRESAILRTLGAKAKVVQGALAIEFITLGALAGFLAAIGAQTGLFFLQTELLQIDFQPSVPLLIAGPVIGGVIIGLVGLASTRRVIKVPPLMVLREL